MSGKNEKDKKPVHQAAALKYDARTDDAPVIVALGQGEIAQKMVQTATENDVPIVQDASLAQVLGGMGVGDEIPQELYGVVAQVLVFIAGLDHKGAERFGIYTAGGAR
jgi:flagellar biosynthesis protein